MSSYQGSEVKQAGHQLPSPLARSIVGGANPVETCDQSVTPIRSTLVSRIEEALASEDGVAILLLSKELAGYGKSDTARKNRTNKPKTLESARADWDRVGIDPIKFHALALILELGTSGHRKWAASIDAALMVLRPDLSFRPGVFKTGAAIPARFARPAGLAGIKLEKQRKTIVRKLKSALAYADGPLAREFKKTEAAMGAMLRDS